MQKNKSSWGGKREGAGRPALNKKSVHLKLSYEAADKLSETAQKENKTMSDIAEAIITQAL